MTSRPLRIAHVDTERTWRGGQQQVFSLIKGLQERGHFNVAVVRAGSALEEKLRSLNIPLLSLTPLFELDPLSAYRMRKFFLQMKIDVVQAHTGHALPLVGCATWKMPIKKIGTRRIDYRVGRNMVSRWSYRAMDKLVAVASGVKDSLIQSGLSGDKIKIIHSGLDFDRFKEISPKLKKDMGVLDDGVVVGQVAALSPQKDQLTFLKTIQFLVGNIPNIHGVILGEGECRSLLEKEARQMGIQDHVHLIGFKPDALAYARGFDVFCLTSKNEGIGGVLIEAMALKVPVVSTMLPGLKDVIDDGVNGVFAPVGDAFRLAAAVEAILTMPAEKKRAMVESAYRKALTFDIKNTVSKTEAVYYDVLGEKQ